MCGCGTAASSPLAAGKAAGCQGPLGRKEMAADEDDALPRSPGQLTDLPCVYEIPYTCTGRRARHSLACV